MCEVGKGVGCIRRVKKKKKKSLQGDGDRGERLFSPVDRIRVQQRNWDLSVDRDGERNHALCRFVSADDRRKKSRAEERGLEETEEKGDVKKENQVLKA